jgi:hypothetical protein
MKKTIIFIVLMITMTGCSKSNPSNGISAPTIPISVSPSEDIAQVNPEPAPTQIPEAGAGEAEYPILESEITDELTAYIYENFGGSGDEMYATSWYKYIDYWEVYQDDKSLYSGLLHLKERPFDTSARILLSEYYSKDELDSICPILLDTAAALNLDDLDICLIGENLYKIRELNDTSTYYYSLAALDIPIYEFLSEGFGENISNVKSAIQNNQISGPDAYQCLVDYMEYTYEGNFDGLSMEKVKKISMAALANFDVVRIETLSVVDQDGKLISTYNKLN